MGTPGRSSAVDADSVDRPTSMRDLDWRVWLGLSLTALYLFFALAYITAKTGWVGFINQPLADMGSFLEGAFAPLAFLWLVIGYFLQQKELQQNTEALRAQSREIERTAQQAAIQTERMVAGELYTRQELFMQMLEHVRAQLGTIAGLLFISSQSNVAGDGQVTPEEQMQLFRDSTIDPQTFSRRLLTLNLTVEGDDQSHLFFYGTDVRARHSNNFIVTFEKLIDEARAVDHHNILEDSLFTSAHGFLYRLLKRHQANAAPELADPKATGTYVAMGLSDEEAEALRASHQNTPRSA